jgi:hypothetical protein
MLVWTSLLHPNTQIYVTINNFGLGTETINRPFNSGNPKSFDQLPVWTIIQLTKSLLPSRNESQQSVNSFCGSSVWYTAVNCIAWFLNVDFNGQSFQYFLVCSFRNMHVMSQRSDLFLSRHSRENISDMAWYFAIRYHLTAVEIELRSFWTLTPLLDSNYSNSLLLEAMISYKNKYVLVLDFSNLMLHMEFDAL